ncbi:NrtA/SsuA/CpmA family ABC transporter substrate-binding protein [Geobacter sulfurreducens]|jgi:NitT/TauT family transport system substrate-binding protein|uniref:NrtA/SsuA/CpmA family ABC transporter substrate-binding protein n=1 Tax=Geobacter sulfurreducens TaxID=35554 RepID=UPI000AD16416|nr:NrtA/SsuA/CpmA family ABC transporter substrate-binding protein [Geobacter sulfurreducens]
MTPRRLSGLFLVFLLVMSAFCSRSTGPVAAAELFRGPQAEVTVAYQPLASPGGIIVQAMQHDRILRRELARRGMSLRFVAAGKGGDVIPMLQKGDAHFATMADMPLIEAVNVVPLSIIGQLKRNYAMVVGPRGLSAKDLKGKRIGNAFATTGHFALLKVLSSAGLSERDVALVPLDVNLMPDALRNGHVDAFAAWEPTPSLTIGRNPDRYGAIGRQQSISFLVSTREFTAQHPEAARQVAAALVRAMHWFKVDRSHVITAVRWNIAATEALTGAKPQVGEREYAKSARADLEELGYSPKMSRSLTSKRSLLLDAQEFLKSIGKVPRAAAEDALIGSFTYDIVEDVMKKPTQYYLSRFDYAP